MVLVHASLLDASSWRPQVEELRKDHRVIAYDMRGHGRTGGSAHAAYTVDLLAQDLRALLHALRLERPVVCGLSLGGMVALTHAVQHPDEVGALVLAGTPTPHVFSARERMERVVMPKVIIPVARLVGYERIKKSLMRAQEGVHGKDAVGAFTADDLPPMPTAEFGKVVRAFAGFHGFPMDLARLQAPTLVLYGQNEPAFIAKHAERIREQVPGAVVRAIPGAGHASNMDQPTLFNQEVRAFLGRLEPGPVRPA